MWFCDECIQRLNGDKLSVKEEYQLKRSLIKIDFFKREMNLKDALLSERRYCNDLQKELIKSYKEKMKDMITDKKLVPNSRTSGEELINKPDTKLK